MGLNYGYSYLKKPQLAEGVFFVVSIKKWIVRKKIGRKISTLKQFDTRKEAQDFFDMLN